MPARIQTLVEWKIPQSAVDLLPDTTERNTLNILTHFINRNATINNDEGSKEALTYVFEKVIPFAWNPETEMGAVYYEFHHHRRAHQYDLAMGCFYDYAKEKFGIEVVKNNEISISYDHLTRDIMVDVDEDENQNRHETDTSWAARLALVEELAVTKKGYVKL